ncbi:hypothetical protein HWV62_39954 [Athelia sp. TMB]|nr:hypothetical protein HWV62_39954 [Athelia sp. TMB]
MFSKHRKILLVLKGLCFGISINLAAGTAIPNEKNASGSAQAVLANSVTANAAIPFSRSIIAVGDLHGDFENAFKVLQMANVVDSHGDWTGEVDFFVQTGDIVDRGNDTIKLYSTMEKLRNQARKVGGDVLSHLGNHEYVYQSEIATFGSVEARQEMISTGLIGRAWAQNYTTTSRLPLHPSLGPPNTDYPSKDATAAQSPLSHAAISFLHGGLAPTYPQLTPFPSAINSLSSSLLHKLQSQSPYPPPYPPNPYPGLPGDSTAEEIRFYGTDGPLWYRGWALEDEDVVCAAVDDVLERTGTRRMVMGHTPDFEKIVTRCNGKIIIIDTGITHVYGGVLSALSIKYEMTPIKSTANDAKQSWKETETIHAIYADRKELLVEEERFIQGSF